MLIALGANVNLGGGVYGSCLNLSMIKFQSFQVQDLLKRGANPNQKDKDGNSSLHYLMTIYNRDPNFAEKICSLLLKNGADPNARNNDGWTPLLIATRKGCFEAI
jgi:cytohesin